MESLRPLTRSRRQETSLALTCAALLGLSLLVIASPATAQLTVSGQVTSGEQAPIAGAEIVVRAADAATVTDARGRYHLVIPEARLTGASARIHVEALGYRSAGTSILLESGEIEENFVLVFDPLKVEEIVATGQGMQLRREALGATVNSVSGAELTATQESNVVAALSGKAPNVRIWTSSGDPGAGAYIRIRGSSSLLGAQPLFVVDGVPISNASEAIEDHTLGTVESNRGIDLNPEDIESVEILKGPAAAVYGSRAAQGVVLITTKRGAPGDARVTLKTSITRDEVTQLQGLQRTHGRGLGGGPFGSPDENTSPNFPASWGPALVPGTPTFDHAGEIYQIGHTYDTDLQVSGGSESTTYFLSLSRLDQNGVIVGNSEFERTTARFTGTQDIREGLSITGNVSYAESGGDFIQKGNSISGIQLGALRTPPEFDNLPYLDPETGLHRSYRCGPESCPFGPFTDPNTSRGYDNPFWIAFEMPTTSEVQRVYGNVQVEYRPLEWLDLTYALGSDFWSDDRRSLWPKSSSIFPQGKSIRAELEESIIDSNLLATISAEVTEDISGSLTLGHNLNHREFERFQVNSFVQITGTDQLDFSIDREPDEFFSEVRTEGIFAQANLELWDQLFVNGGIRGDKASTFGEEKRFWYSNGSVAWEFTAHPMFSALRGVGTTQGEGPLSFLDFGKVRFAYGEVGQHPPVFSNVSAFTTGTIGNLSTIYAGFDGVISEATLGNPNIEPERSKEWEVGFELAMLDNRLALDVVRYDKQTEEAILSVPVAPSTGFFSQFRNGAEFDNEGWEIRVDGRPVQTSNFTWDVRAQWAKDESCVKELLGAEAVYLAGFNFAQVSVVQPRDLDGDGVPDEEGCFPFGVHRGADFVRFGRGIAVGGVDIDGAFPSAPDGAIFLAEDGLPRFDGQIREIGDPNPDWTGSVRNTITLFNKVRLSALIDFVQGFDRWNGTKGVLFFFGTHEATGPCHDEGCTFASFSDYYREVLNIDDETFAGPGIGQEVTLNWANWFVGGIGSAFTGPQPQFIEDASFVKLRDVSVSYTFDHPRIRETTGFSSIDVRVSGRNLVTWTDYSGIDPEAEMGDQILGRGLEYFNNPLTESLVLTLQFSR